MAYVLNSWARAAHAHVSSALFLAKQGEAPPFALFKRLFDAHQKRIIDRSSVRIACDADDPSTILGYLISEHRDGHPPVLHYVQVKRDLMRKGVASALLEHAAIKRDSSCVFTFTSPIQGKVRTPDHWVYVPFWLVNE